MQSFLPYPSFQASAEILDFRRLGKMRVEAWQIYEILNGKKSRWANHPAVKMWRGYPMALLKYGETMCAEWIKRGYKDTMRERFVAAYIMREYFMSMPPWIGREDFHLSHRSNLCRKDEAYYGRIFGDIPNNLPYIWP